MTMEVGDLVITRRSPFDVSSLFHYKNGEIGIVVQVFEIENRYRYQEVKVLFFEPERELIIPVFYLDKLGE
jgi:hypothetical protein